MEAIEQAKRAIAEELEGFGAKPVKVLLFGSRATGHCRADSDWDFYVVVNRELPHSDRREIATRIRTRLAQDDMAADIFIQAENVVQQRANNTGYLTYYALKEGVEV